MTQMMVAAVVGAARGLKGEVGLDLRTDRPEECFFPGATLHTESPDFPTLTAEGLSYHGGRALAFFEEIVTREDAEAIRGLELLVEESPEADAWYSHELAGLTAVSPSGEVLGTVTELRFGAAQDLLAVDAEMGEVLVPFVSELVPEVLVAEGRVVIDPPGGLFDLGEAE